MTFIPVLDHSKFIQILDAEKNAKSLIAEQKNDHAIEQLSGASKLAEEGLLASLYLSRATAYYNLGQNDLALADAKEVNRLYPTSPYGYLQSADICFATKEYQVALFTIWDGIKAVKSDKPEYSLLVNKRKCLEKEIDAMNSKYLNRLPQDLYRDIFLSLRPEERFKCLYLCKAWNRILSKWGDLWLRVDSLSTTLESKNASFFQLLSKHRVQHIRLPDLHEGTAVFGHMCDYNFNGLKTLSFKFCDPDVSALRDLLRLCEMNRDSLISFGMMRTFGNYDAYEIETYSSILSICQKLRRVCLTTPFQRELPNAAILPEHTLNLTHLGIMYCCLSFGKFRVNVGMEQVLEHLSNMLIACPALQVLILCSEDFYTRSRAKRLLKLLSNRCLNLKQVIILSKNGFHKRMEQLPDVSESPVDTVLQLPCFPNTEYETSLLLSRLRTTLTVFDTHVYGVQWNYGMWETIVWNGGFPCLRELTLRRPEEIPDEYYNDWLEREDGDDENGFNDMDYVLEMRRNDTEARIIATIIGISPSLQIIHLENLCLNDIDIFKNLARLANLRRLDMSTCIGIGLDGLQILCQFNTSIQELAINASSIIGSDADDVLDTIANSPHKTLRKLELRNYRPRKSLELFVDKMKYSRLSNIVFADLQPVHEFIAPIFALPSLIYIKLHWRLCNNCTLDMDEIMASRHGHIYAVVEEEEEGRKTRKTYLRDYDGQLRVD